MSDCKIRGLIEKDGKLIISSKIDGVKIYDPRDKQFKVSDNPALVMADLAQRKIVLTPWEFDDDFWQKIAKLADFCDSLPSLVRTFSPHT